MTQSKVYNFKNIHFIGIGGISMSGICQLLLNENTFNISGSDLSKSPITDDLAKKGVKIYIGQNAQNISKNIDLVVYTAAIGEDNEELKKAKQLGIKTISRSQFLGEIMQSYKYPVCVAGTHGKTTTSSFVSEVFLASNYNPTISIGGILSSINGNLKIGDKDFFVLETCEYQDSFLDFKPHSSIILNIDLDHLDYFKNLEQIYNSFKKFSQLIPQNGCLVINSDIENYEYVTSNLNCNVITYGKNDNSIWKAKNINYDENGFPSYTATKNNEEMFNIKLNVFGEHNVYNSLAVCALCDFYNLDKNTIEQGLQNFKGTKRRFEFKGEFNGAKVIDDYAHHPTEILATIECIKKQNHKKAWCIFQPHTFSRTKSLLKEFANSFAQMENIIILDIYPAREKDTKEIHSKDLVNEINSLNKNAIYMDSFQNCIDFLHQNCDADDLVVTIGAGDITLLADMLVNQ